MIAVNISTYDCLHLHKRKPRIHTYTYYAPVELSDGNLTLLLCIAAKALNKNRYYVNLKQFTLQFL